MKYYFYAPSYVTIKQYLYLKSKFKDVILVSRNYDLIQFAIYMHWNILNFSDSEANRETRSRCFILKVRNFLKFKKQLKRNIDNAIAQLDYGNFYFSTLLIDYWILRFVHRLSQKGSMNLIYLNDVKVTANYIKLDKVSWRQRVTQSYFKFSYNLPLMWFDCAGAHFLGVDHNFRKRCGIDMDESIDPFYFDAEVSQFPIKKVIEVLIIGGQRIDENSQFLNTDDIRSVYRFIKQIRPDAYFKYHPGESIHDDLSDSFEQIDSFIPVEFLGSSIKIALGDFSTALIGLSLKGVLCISFLNLVESYPRFDNEFWKRKLHEDSRGMILFVNSFDELSNLLRTDILR